MSVTELVRKGTLAIKDDNHEFIGALLYDRMMDGSERNHAQLKIPVDSVVATYVLPEERPRDVHYFQNGQYIRSDICRHPPIQTERPSMPHKLKELFPVESVNIAQFQIPDAVKKALKAVDDSYLKDTIEAVVGNYL